MLIFVYEKLHKFKTKIIGNKIPKQTMDPDWKHSLKAIALFLFGLIIKSYLLNGPDYSIFVHITYILILILVVYKFLQSYKLPPVADTDFTALILGAGFSGLGMAVKLQEMGVKFRIIEKAKRLGGTWRENVYPGCGCDVPSHLYSYSFYMNPEWSRSYAGQEEILKYMDKMADHYGLTNKVEFSTKAVKSTWNPVSHKWHVELDTGEVIIANVVVSAIGGLHVPNTPTFEGKDSFKGDAFHSAQWKKDYDPTGRTVAVIGTGASAVQVVPNIAGKVKKLYVFQRTPCWTGEKDDWAHPAWLRFIFKIYPPAMYLLRLLYFWRSELVFFIGIRSNGKYKNIVKNILTKYMKKNVKDPDLVKKLIPNYEVGCKRITPSNHYIQTFNRDNVTLVTDPIKMFTEDGIQTADGMEHKVDTIIYATGFSLVDHVRGLEARVPKHKAQDRKTLGQDNGSICNGVSKDQTDEYKNLADEWGDEPNAYLGITYPGFPNSFYILGPGTGLGVGSLMLNLECQFSYICQCIRYMIEKNVRVMDVKKDVNDEFQIWARETIKNKAFAHASCTSWYRNKRGVTWTMWPAQPFLYWWYTLKLDPLNFNRK